MDIPQCDLRVLLLLLLLSCSRAERTLPDLEGLRLRQLPLQHRLPAEGVRPSAADKLDDLRVYLAAQHSTTVQEKQFNCNREAKNRRRTIKV